MKETNVTGLFSVFGKSIMRRRAAFRSGSLPTGADKKRSEAPGGIGHGTARGRQVPVELAEFTSLGSIHATMRAHMALVRNRQVIVAWQVEKRARCCYETCKPA